MAQANATPTSARRREYFLELVPDPDIINLRKPVAAGVKILPIGTKVIRKLFADAQVRKSIPPATNGAMERKC